MTISLQLMVMITTQVTVFSKAYPTSILPHFRGMSDTTTTTESTTTTTTTTTEAINDTINNGTFTGHSDKSEWLLPMAITISCATVIGIGILLLMCKFCGKKVERRKRFPLSVFCTALKAKALRKRNKNQPPDYKTRVTSPENGQAVSDPANNHSHNTENGYGMPYMGSPKSAKSRKILGSVEPSAPPAIPSTDRANDGGASPIGNRLEMSRPAVPRLPPISHNRSLVAVKSYDESGDQPHFPPRAPPYSSLGFGNGANFPTAMDGSRRPLPPLMPINRRPTEPDLSDEG